MPDQPRQLSGVEWVSRFPDAGATAALDDAFRPGCEAFISAMRDGGATVAISSTRRPRERAYLMHWAWFIHKRMTRPEDVPRMSGVNIEWVHRRGDGSIDQAKSRAAASAMVEAYNIAYQPALNSRHTEGRAIDMSISWSGSLVVARKNLTKVTISGTPRSGTNQTLWGVGQTYGVRKNANDPPHWSTDGH